MNSASYPEYYRGYIEKIPEGNPLELLMINLKETTKTLAMVSDDQANGAYEEGKWSIKDVVQHIIDTERIFCFRALAIARGEKGMIPGYDHNAYADNSMSNERTLKSLLEELKNVRISTIDLFKNFNQKMMQTEGNANGVPFIVEQFLYIIIGHEMHHRGVIEQKYL